MLRPEMCLNVAAGAGFDRESGGNVGAARVSGIEVLKKFKRGG